MSCIILHPIKTVLHGFKRICLSHVPPSDFQSSVNLRVLVLALNRNRTHQRPVILPRGRFFKPFIDDLLCKQPTSQSVQRKISSMVGCDVEETYEVEKRPGIDNQGILHRSMITWHGADNAPNGENVFQHAKHFGRDFQLQYIAGKR